MTAREYKKRPLILSHNQRLFLGTMIPDVARGCHDTRCRALGYTCTTPLYASCMPIPQGCLILHASHWGRICLQNNRLRQKKRADIARYCLKSCLIPTRERSKKAFFSTKRCVHTPRFIALSWLRMPTLPLFGTLTGSFCGLFFFRSNAIKENISPVAEINKKLSRSFSMNLTRFAGSGNKSPV